MLNPCPKLQQAKLEIDPFTAFVLSIGWIPALHERYVGQRFEKRRIIMRKPPLFAGVFSHFISLEVWASQYVLLAVSSSEITAHVKPVFPEVSVSYHRLIGGRISCRIRA